MLKTIVEKGSVIQTEFVVDNSNQRSSPMTTRKEETKDYGSSSGVI